MAIGSVAGFGATLLAIGWREWGRPHLHFTHLDLVPLGLLVLQTMLGVASSYRSLSGRRFGRALVWLLLTAALLALMLAEYAGWLFAVMDLALPSDWKIDAGRR